MMALERHVSQRPEMRAEILRRPGAEEIRCRPDRGCEGACRESFDTVYAGFALLARRVVLSVDWTLLLVFMAMFIDVHLLTQLPALQGVLSNVSHLSEPGLWLTAIGLSQVISNVPSTILLLNYVPPSLLLAWAVNVGGFGLLPGSLANLIALRMANDRRIWWRFHLYSIPMLLWAALVGYVLFVMLPAW